MQVQVNSDLDVVLADSGNFTSFDLRVASGVEQSHLARALQGIAELDGDRHAWVRESWLTGELTRAPPSATSASLVAARAGARLCWGEQGILAHLSPSTTAFRFRNFSRRLRLGHISALTFP